MGWFTFLYPQSEEIAETLRLVRHLVQQGDHMATTLDDILSSVEEEDAVDDSIITLLNGIKEQLDAVIAGELTPAQQAKVDKIFTKVESSKAKVEAAILANTPQAEPPPA